MHKREVTNTLLIYVRNERNMYKQVFLIALILGLQLSLTASVGADLSNTSQNNSTQSF